jgi:porin
MSARFSVALSGISYGLGVALLLGRAPAALSQLWSDDVRFESDCCVENDSSACGEARVCASAVTAPNVGGCCWERTKLTGDWGGCRNCQAEQGITYDFDATMFYFGVASGGLEQDFAFGGHNDYLINIDAGKLGVQDGLFLKLRAEHRYGEDINRDTGALLPATLLTELPVADSEELYLTNVWFTQMFSEEFGVFFGKLDTLDGDANAFASGRGKTQFSNVAFVFNPITIRTIPYSTLGAGFFILHEGVPLFTYTILNATDTTRTSGFDELFADGVAMSAELRLPVKVAGLPGHQLFGGTWNSRDFAALGQDPRIILPDVPIAEQSGSWSLYWNCDQYLYVDPCNQARGWGVFGRAGIGDDETNPLEWFLSAGIGGSGLFRGRERDTFGAGWYYAGTSNEIGPIIQIVFGPTGDGQGVEVFYNAEVTPWLHLTPDVQVIMPAREDVDTALVLGIRARIEF